MKVLFVCSGNICRSPMAAAAFRHHAARCDLSHVVVASAGTLGIVDSPAADEAVAALAELGIDLRDHRSSALSSAGLRSSDLVVAMARDHLDYLAQHFPEGRDVRLLLRAFESSAEPDPDAPDLEDPIGAPLALYRRQARLIVRCIEHLALHVKRLQGNPR